MIEVPFWWCDACNKNVFILHAYDVGIFCRECGGKVKMPANLPEPTFYDTDEEEELIIEEDIDEDKIN